ncbi:MAG: helix-hairpin-helix domain-containing protein [Cytophagales bacterium]|nr:helix-hairpin-helix domain-containing protein [Cytophagales bacterium]
MKNFFEFSYKERRAFWILLMIMVLAILAPFFVRFSIEQENINPDYTSQLDSLAKVIEQEKEALAQEKKPKTYYKKYISKKKKDTTTYQKKKYTKQVKKEQRIETFELNTATAKDLKQVKGIGEKLSERIIKYRDKLGGFYQQEQLYEVYYLDSAVVQKTLKYCTLDTSLVHKTILLNKKLEKQDFKILLKHPYLNYEDVKAIFNYSRKKGQITNREMLKEAIGEEKAEKVWRYVLF